MMRKRGGAQRAVEPRDGRTNCAVSIGYKILSPEKKWVVSLPLMFTQEAEHLIRDSTCDIFKDDLEPLTLLPLPLKCQTYRHVPPCPVYVILGEQKPGLDTCQTMTLPTEACRWLLLTLSMCSSSLCIVSNKNFMVFRRALCCSAPSSSTAGKR